MKVNEGTVDRIVRVIVGLALLIVALLSLQGAVAWIVVPWGDVVDHRSQRCLRFVCFAQDLAPLKRDKLESNLPRHFFQFDLLAQEDRSADAGETFVRLAANSSARYLPV